MCIFFVTFTYKSLKRTQTLTLKYTVKAEIVDSVRYAWKDRKRYGENYWLSAIL